MINAGQIRLERKSYFPWLVSWFLQLSLLLLYPGKTNKNTISVATSEDLKISILDLAIFRGILFEAQFQAARFTTAISMPKQASQAIKRQKLEIHDKHETSHGHVWYVETTEQSQLQFEIYRNSINGANTL